MNKASRTVCLVVASFLIISCGEVIGQRGGSCKSRADCHMKCESGLPTCVDRTCVCLAPKTYSTDHKGERCKTKEDCHRKCEGGIPFCVEGTCTCI